MGNLLSALRSPAAVGVLIAVALIGYTIYSYAYAPYQVLKRCGIRGPKPLPIVGNRALQNQGWIKLHEGLMKNYGPIAGHYIGSMPVVMMADAKSLETVLIKNVDDFQDLRSVLPYLFSDEGLPNGLTASRGAYWRKLRGALEPLFSTVNERAMSAVVQRKCDTLMMKLGELADTGKSGDIYPLIYSQSVETVIAVIYGRETNVQNGVKDEFAEATRIGFKGRETDSDITPLMLQYAFPFLKRLVQWLFRRSDKGKSFAVMVRATREWLAKKKQARTAQKYKDLMQLMIDTQVGSDGFTDGEIISQTMTFMIGVHENLCNVIAHTIYLLALNPSVQDKLRTEIRKFFRNNPEASMYDASQKLQYLDMVMDESTRVCTPIPRLSRMCTKTTQFDGFTIEAGTAIDLPYYMLHHDPRYWPNPEIFDPQRHTPEKKAQRPPLCLLPLGGGKRVCLGKKIASVMYKMTVAEAVMKYKFIRAPDTEVPLSPVNGSIGTSPKNGIYLKISALQ